jgi:hypothetical protein
MRIRLPLLMAIVLLTGSALAQQSVRQTQQSMQPAAIQQPVIANPEQAKFVSSPSVPDCYSYALERGDPKGSSSITLAAQQRIPGAACINPNDISPTR